jgi:hypothetical protein
MSSRYLVKRQIPVATRINWGSTKDRKSHTSEEFRGYEGRFEFVTSSVANFDTVYAQNIVTEQTDGIFTDIEVTGTASINNVASNAIFSENLRSNTISVGNTTLRGYPDGDDIVLTFPEASPFSGQGLISDDEGVLSWEYLVESNDNRLFDAFVLRVKKTPGLGEFSSVASAVNSISDSSETSRYVIEIGPGVYNEPPFSLPPFTWMVGTADLSATILTPALPNAPSFISLSNSSGFAFLTIDMLNGTAIAVSVIDPADFALLHKVDINNSGGVALLAKSTEATSDTSYAYFEYVSVNGTFENASQVASIQTEPNAPGVSVICENFYAQVLSDNPECAISVDGIGSSVVLNLGRLSGNGPIGDALRVSDGASLDIIAFSCTNWQNGIVTLTGGSAPSVNGSGGQFICSGYNFDILHDGTVGQYFGPSPIPKNRIPPNAPFNIYDQVPSLITVAEKGGDFSSIADAMDYITDNSPERRYAIRVRPGVYTERTITCKPYVSIEGDSQVSILALDPEETLIVGAPACIIRTVTLAGVTEPSKSLILYDGSSFSSSAFTVQNCTFGECSYACRITSNNGPSSSSFLTTRQSMNTEPLGVFRIESDASPSNYLLCRISQFIYSDTSNSNVERMIHVSGTQSQVNLNDVILRRVNPGPGTGLHVTNGASVDAVGLEIGSFAIGVCVPDENVPGPQLRLYGLNCLDTNTLDLDVRNGLTSGYVDGGLSLAKCFVTENADLVGTFQSAGDGLVITGPLVQGEAWGEVTNITDSVQRCSALGVIQGGELSVDGQTIRATAGKGYLMSGSPYPNDNLRLVSWAAGQTSVSEGLNYIYITAAGLASAASKPDLERSILLGACYVQSGVVLFINKTPVVALHAPNLTNNFLTGAIGNIVSAGLIVSENASQPRKLDVSNGKYYFGSSVFEPVAVTATTFLQTYNNGSGWTTSSTDTVPVSWNSLSTLQPIPNGFFAKHSFFVLNADVYQTYILIVGSEIFATRSEAESGPIPLAPPWLAENACPIAGIVVEGGQSNIISIRDIRPIIGFKPEGVSSSEDHNSLLNLTVGNAHPQYFRVDGSSPMLSDVNLGGNNVVNVGLVKGIDVALHGSRHSPTGPDPLPIGTPVTIGTANSIGVAGSYALSDHVHSHGVQTNGTLHAVATGSVNGFMSAADKTKLDTSTSLATINSIVQRNSLGASLFSGLEIVSNGSLLLRNASNFAIGVRGSASQATNFTITLPASLGTAGQAMVTNGSGVLSFAAPAPASHSSTHLPNGTDPLLTATPVTIGTTNFIGTANSFSRSDHTHAHGSQTDSSLHAVATSGSSGFMSADDKLKLDQATVESSPGTIVMRGPESQIRADIVEVVKGGSLRLFDKEDKFFTALESATLRENLTFTLPPNYGEEGQVLQTDGRGTLYWASLPRSVMFEQFKHNEESTRILEAWPSTFLEVLRSTNSGDTLLLNSGIYRGAIILPDGVHLMGKGNVTIMMNSTSPVDLVTMGSGSRLENVHLKLTSDSSASLRGIVFPTAASGASLCNVRILIDNSKAGEVLANVVAVHFLGKDQSNGEAMRDCDISVVSPGYGDKRGVLVSGDTKISIRNSSISVTSQKGNGIGAETIAGIATFQGCNLFGSSSDISQTNGRVVLNRSTLQTVSCNSHPFETNDMSFLQFSASGKLSSSIGRYMSAGYGGLSLYEQTIPVVRDCIVRALVVQVRVRPGPGNTDRFVLRINSKDTNIVAGIIEDDKMVCIPAGIQIKSGDALSIAYNGSSASEAEDAHAMLEMFT